MGIHRITMHLLSASAVFVVALNCITCTTKGRTIGTGCGDGVCEGNETPSNCPDDCRCGNGVAEPNLGEECDGVDLAGTTCRDYNCEGGLLTCMPDCVINTSGCQNCNVPPCGNGVIEGPEECDCGTDPQNLPMGCTGVNGAMGGECEVDCTRVTPCTGGDVYDDCDPTDPEACCDDVDCGLDHYCESSAFTSPICMPACASTAECYYNTICFTQYGMCYAALCGPGQWSLIGGQLNEVCQVPQGNQGWCVPVGMANDDYGLCIESGAQQHGQTCTPAENMDMTMLCRDDPNVLLCERGVCAADQTCSAFCDPVDVYENDNNAFYCPAGHNCWNYSAIVENDPDDGGCRTADYAACLATAATDPFGGINTCDLVNGELIEDRSQICSDLNPNFECSLISYQGGDISWGTRIGVCADGQPDANLDFWQQCDPNGVCPPETMCLEEDIFSADASGITRCIPFCDTQDASPCNQQHPEVPAAAECTSVSSMFDGPCTETRPSKLGFCALPP